MIGFLLAILGIVLIVLALVEVIPMLAGIIVGAVLLVCGIAFYVGPWDHRRRA